MKPEPLEELTPHVKTAEAAVATITDPRLREIAFGRILDHLLKSQNATSVGQRTTVRKSTSTRPVSRNPSNGVRAWVRELVTDSFFSEPKSLKHILEELSNRSHHLRMTDLT